MFSSREKTGGKIRLSCLEYEMGKKKEGLIYGEEKIGVIEKNQATSYSKCIATSLTHKIAHMEI